MRVQTMDPFSFSIRSMQGLGNSNGRGVRQDETGWRKADLPVVLNGEVLAEDHAVFLEPLAAVRLGGVDGCIDPEDHQLVVATAVGAVEEGLPRQGADLDAVGTQGATARADLQPVRVRRLQGKSDAMGAVVLEADVVHVRLREGRVEDDLRVRLCRDQPRQPPAQGWG